MVTNPNSIRNNPIPIYMTPELKQSIENLSKWFGFSRNKMLNRLLRLGLSNAEFMMDAEQKKEDYKQQRRLEYVNLTFNRQQDALFLDKKEAGYK